MPDEREQFSLEEMVGAFNDTTGFRWVVKYLVDNFDLAQWPMAQKHT